MKNTNMHELREASLQLNLRLAGSIGILFIHEDKHKMRDEVLLFFEQVTKASGMTEERVNRMFTAVGDGPHHPITDGLL